MNEQNTTDEQKPNVQHVVFTTSITSIEGQEPMVVTRITVDGKIMEVPFALVLGDDAGMQIAQVPQSPEGASAFSTSLLKMSLGIASQIIKAAKGEAPASTTAKAA